MTQDRNDADGAHPRRLYFDDLADEPGHPADGPSGQPESEPAPEPAGSGPVAVPARLAARLTRARNGDNDPTSDPSADTGPIEVIREPIRESDAGSAAGPTGAVVGAGQLYFDDVGDTDEPTAAGASAVAGAAAGTAGGSTAVRVESDEPGHLAPAAAGGGGRRREYRPIGAVVALLGVLVLVGVIASVEGKGQRQRDTAVRPSAVASASSTPSPSRASSAPTSARPLPTRTTSLGAAPTHASRPARTHTAPALTQAQLAGLPLTVLNNTTTSGLAKQAAAQFTSRGWRIGPVGNYTGRVAVTTVYYSPAVATQRTAAEALARQFPSVTQVAPRFAGLPGSGLTVVLAPDWSS